MGHHQEQLIRCLLVKKQEQLVQEAEIKMAIFIIKHNIPFKVMDYFTELLPQLSGEPQYSYEGGGGFIVRKMKVESKNMVI